MLIGITGKLRNGKDSVADVFVSDFNFEKRSFAKPIKDACKIIFGWNDDHLYGKLKDVEDTHYGITPRLAMQLLGSEFGQFCLCEHSLSFAKTTGRGLWVKRCLSDIKGKNIVVPDVRFLHEARAIRDVGGKIIRVTRPGFENHSTHPSETEMSEIAVDAEIVNNDTLDALRQNVHNVYSMLLNGVLF